MLSDAFQTLLVERKTPHPHFSDADSRRLATERSTELAQRLFTHPTTALAKEGPIPLSIFSRIDRVVVPPDDANEGSKHARKHDSEDRQRRRGSSLGSAHHRMNVRYERRECDEDRPPSELQVRPFHRRPQTLRKLRLVNTVHDRSADNHVRAIAPEQETP